jgi:CRISPR-associated endonuclease/helicase Cas3
MSRLELKDFPNFFAAVRGGTNPFPWQCELAKSLVTTGRWPDGIIVPTSGGKTAVVDAHIFAVAAMADGWGARVARRLVLVVPRRVLVDSHFDHACHIAQLLRDATPDPNSVLWRVAEALRKLRWQHAPEDGPVPGSPLVVARLRGGLPVPRAWRDDPVACAVISATPEMWGSRLLFRGYGSSPRAWPREAGLLGVDTVAVVDEAHLARQLLVSARAVAALESSREGKCFRGVPMLQVVETTATPLSDEEDSAAATEIGDADPDACQSTSRVDTIGITKEDLKSKTLERRLCMPKKLHLHRGANAPIQNGRGKQAATANDQQVVAEPATPAAESAGKTRRSDLVDEIIEQTLRLREDFGPTVGVFVNTVGLAVDVASGLRKKTRREDGASLSVELVCGRLRDYDLADLRERRPNLLSTEGNKDVDVLVATQSLEVGVDLDLAAAVSVLAPVQSLVQRAGRVNRLGKREKTEFVVVVPKTRDELGQVNASLVGPYPIEDLQVAYDWLEEREKCGGDLSPWVLAHTRLPSALARRPLFQRVELADSWWWARTSDNIDPPVDLDLWLVDEFEAAPAEAGVVVRKAMPSDVTDAIELIKAIRPQDDEVFSAPISEVRKLRDKLVEQPDQDDAPATLIVRGDEVFDAAEITWLRPGDILVIDDRTPCFTEHVLNVDRLRSSKQASQANSDAGCEPDISERRTDPRPGEVVLRIDPDVWTDGEAARVVLAQYENILSTVTTESERRQELAEVLQEYENCSSMVSRAIDLLRDGRVKHSDIVPFWTDDEEPSLRRLVIVDQRTAPSDETIRQVWTISDEPPSLEQHANAVAKRARELGELLGLDAQLVEALGLGGQHHDDGKADLRFQRERLGWKEGDLLAKGRRASTRAEGPSTLPARWRHEQLSVVKAELDLQTPLTPKGVDRDLPLRLVGTSHGHGRVSFPHAAAELLPEDGSEPERNNARRFYDVGEWDDLIERTHRRYGVWGCAFLEAVLRAADGQVSGEGS